MFNGLDVVLQRCSFKRHDDAFLVLLCPPRLRLIATDCLCLRGGASEEAGNDAASGTV